MNISNLELGYRIRRLVLEPCGGARIALPLKNEQSLIIFPHNMKAFAIPYEYAACLALAYKRYLMASGILDWSKFKAEEFDDDHNYDEEAFLYDRTTLSLFHQANGVPLKESMFNLDAAIEFVEQETNLARTLAIRWCMMMEYITFEDQRLVAKQKCRVQEKPINDLPAGKLIKGVDDG